MLVSVGIVVLAGASTVAVVATRDAVSTKDSEGREQSLLPDFRGEDVTRLELFGNGPRAVIERSGTAAGSANFQLLEPVREAADPAVVDKFLSALASARALRPVEQGPTPSALGLDKPALRLRVQTKKRAFQLALGGNAPTPAGARYLQIAVDQESPRVVVVAKAVADDLAVELDAFRIRSMVSVSEADVTRIGITSPKLRLDLDRSTGTNFVIAEQQAKVLVNRETLKTLFFQLSRLTASAFLSESEAEAALGAERAHFELELKQPKNNLR
jgi:hypothetical protein